MDSQQQATLIRGVEALYRASLLEVMMTRYRWTAEAAERLSGEVAATVRDHARRDHGDRARATATAGASSQRQSEQNE